MIKELREKISQNNGGGNSSKSDVKSKMILSLGQMYMEYLGHKPIIM